MFFTLLFQSDLISSLCCIDMYFLELSGELRIFCVLTNRCRNRFVRLFGSVHCGVHSFVQSRIRCQNCNTPLSI